MVEKITIAELNLDTKALIVSASKTKKEIESLKDSQKELSKEGKKGSAQFVENEVAIKKLSTSYTKQKNTLVALTDENNKFISTEKATNTALNKNVTTINGARSSNKELLAIRGKLNLSTAKGKKELDQINTKLDKNNAFIKDNVSAYEQQKIGIGDYEGALRKVFPASGQLIDGLKRAKEGLAAQKVAMNGSTAATTLSSKALRVFRIALLATGIGAIVVVLGSLIAFLSTTQSGIDKVTAVTRPLKAIFQSLIGIFQTVGENLFNAFSNPKQVLIDLVDFVKNNVINRFKALSIILDGIINLDFKKIGEGFVQATTGVEDFIQKAKDAGKATSDFLTEAAEKGAEIDRLQKSIEAGEARLVLTRAQTSKQLRELQLIANDRTLSAEKNNEAANQAILLAKELSTAEKEIVNQKIKQEEIQQSLNDSGREDQKKLNELRAQAIAADEKAAATELKFLTAKAGLVNEQKAEAKKLADDKKKQDQKLLDDKKTSEDAELERDRDFAARKKELQNTIALQNEEDAIAKQQLKLEQDAEKQIAELELLNITEQQKTELLALMETERQQLLNDIIAESQIAAYEQQLEANEKLIEGNTKLTDSDKNTAQIRANVASTLTGVLTGLLGDSLGAKLASIAIEAGIQAGLVKIEGAAASGKITAGITSANAAAIAASPLTGGLPFTAINTAQGVGLQASNAASTARAITGILTGAALKGLGSVSTSKFEKGGLQSVGGKRHSSGGTKFTGEDGTRFEAERGELIGVMSRQASEKFMDFNNKHTDATSFGNSLNFENGGTIPVNGGSTVTDSNTQLANMIAASINGIKVVAIVDDIAGGLALQTEIIDGANI